MIIVRQPSFFVTYYILPEKLYQHYYCFSNSDKSPHFLIYT